MKKTHHKRPYEVSLVFTITTQFSSTACCASLHCRLSHLLGGATSLWNHILPQAQGIVFFPFFGVPKGYYSQSVLVLWDLLKRFLVYLSLFFVCSLRQFTCWVGFMVRVWCAPRIQYDGKMACHNIVYLLPLYCITILYLCRSFMTTEWSLHE